jgi:hypothetical protein
MLPRYLADSLQDFTAILCQVEGVEPPVLRVWLALDKFSLLEIVQDGHEPAGMDLQLRRKFLLADPRRHAQESQDSCVRWGELQGR